jgi:hypothetical protein
MTLDRNRSDAINAIDLNRIPLWRVPETPNDVSHHP